MNPTHAQLRAYAARPWEEIEARSQSSIRLGMSADQRLLASSALAALRRRNTTLFERERTADLDHHLALCAAFAAVHAGRLPRGA